jgi:hypothetical protein
LLGAKHGSVLLRACHALSFKSKVLVGESGQLEACFDSAAVLRGSEGMVVVLVKCCAPQSLPTAAHAEFVRCLTGILCGWLYFSV